MKSRLKNMFSQDAGWVFLFCAVLMAFYPELWLARSAPLTCDHWEQHYPWAFSLYQFLHHFELPLWTTQIQCGFPIAAESQIGIFYLPNLILSLLLPFHAAYSYTVLIHFLIAGLGTYAYGRMMGLIRPAAFLAAFLFVFGTSYGGAYYNITSLKTLAWFPMMLWLWEKWLSETRTRWLALLALIGAQSLVAGYMQVASLGLFIFGIYALVRLGMRVWTSPDWAKLLLRLAVPAILFAMLGVLLAMPQILLTFQMAAQSNRTGTSEGYAYVGSLSPLALWTLLLPNLQGLFRGNCLYSGGLAIFCVLAAARRGTTSSAKFGVWLGMLVFSLLLALGQWSPLYVGLIKLTHFYSFRTPSKFLIFFNFYFVMLAALGFEKLLQACNDNQGQLWIRKKAAYFTGILGVVLGTVFLIKGLLVGQRNLLINLGEWLLRETLYGREGHPHAWPVYQAKLNDMLVFADQVFSFSYRWTVWMAFVLACWLVWGLGFRYARNLKRMLIAGFFLAAVDLYGFSYADVRSDYLPYSKIQAPSAAIKALLQARSDETLGRIYGFREGEHVPSLIPSVNMLYGIEDIGSYSPLVPSRYYETIGTFGNVNDSNQMLPVTPNFVLKRLELLSGLDVSHIISKVELNDPRLLLVTSPENTEKVYRLNLPRARTFFPPSISFFERWEDLKQRLMGEGFDPQAELLLERSELSLGDLPRMPYRGKVLAAAWGNGKVRFDLEAQGAAPFVMMQTDAAGWRFTLNGQPVRILKAYGVFQAVWLPSAGRYTLEGRYELGEATKGRRDL
ncbi:MAG: hypothetical protein KBC91_01000 [Candidatus Omnitrophica bacterium]|nr:hypothetical protein [Candidatus Omnitrophota bacterium]